MKCNQNKKRDWLKEYSDEYAKHLAVKSLIDSFVELPFWATLTIGLTVGIICAANYSMPSLHMPLWPAFAMSGIVIGLNVFGYFWMFFKTWPGQLSIGHKIADKYFDYNKIKEAQIESL
jgi:hypothetical protein